MGCEEEGGGADRGDAENTAERAKLHSAFCQDHRHVTPNWTPHKHHNFRVESLCK
jgi:hypothetical protein